MRGGGTIAILLTAASLGGCDDAPDPSSPAAHRGRYHGIGTYPAGRTWSRMATTGQPANDARANLSDDHQIIVVVDSQTGEVRQCGNLSGYCIGMNPWSAAIGQDRALPVNLTAHAADLDRANEAAAQEANDSDRNDVATERARPDRR